MSGRKNILVSMTGDYTTKLIADWLKYFDADVEIFYTDQEKVAISSIQINNQSSSMNLTSSEGKTLNTEQAKTVFFRRGRISLNNATGFRTNPGNFDDIENKVKYFFTTHDLAQQELVNHFYLQGKTYGKDNGSRTNKIVNLKEAAELGFNVPNTLVTTSKGELANWFKPEMKVITKALDIGMFFSHEQEGKVYQQLTKSIAHSDIKVFPDVFPLTVFQERIEKLIELRVFYIGGKCWASAIISQQQENTKEDYRNYNPDQMNRVVPFELPDNLSKRIHELMLKLNMETGSLDIILAEDGNYYFLEVNPSGQFTAISEKCNYQLEREIALNMMEDE